LLFVKQPRQSRLRFEHLSNQGSRKDLKKDTWHRLVLQMDEIYNSHSQRMEHSITQ
jgi:hypothetical protein